VSTDPRIDEQVHELARSYARSIIEGVDADIGARLSLGQPERDDPDSLSGWVLPILCDGTAIAWVEAGCDTSGEPLALVWVIARPLAYRMDVRTSDEPLLAAIVETAATDWGSPTAPLLPLTDEDRAELLTLPRANATLQRSILAAAISDEPLSGDRPTMSRRWWTAWQAATRLATEASFVAERWGGRRDAITHRWAPELRPGIDVLVAAGYGANHLWVMAGYAGAWAPVLRLLAAEPHLVALMPPRNSVAYTDSTARSVLSVMRACSTAPVMAAPQRSTAPPLDDWDF
jgi:hypothetical protein